eukprot:Pompholyxophrys_punicea_v1_NODE_115_length_3387_cov_15.520108.p1 type:complete len:177 gc:universal NODE_115_length_3387_cov_15.520108:2484-1954(-)
MIHLPLPLQHDRPIPATPPAPTNTPFILQPITIEQVLNIIYNLRYNRAHDAYHILPALIIDAATAIAPLIVPIFNQIIISGTYPSTLKLTRIAAILKSKDPTSPQNYRPISIVPILATIIDSHINSQLITHLLQNNLLNPHQFAFRPNSDTTAALTTISDHLHRTSTKTTNPRHIH